MIKRQATVIVQPRPNSQENGNKNQAVLKSTDLFRRALNFITLYIGILSQPELIYICNQPNNYLQYFQRSCI